MLGTSAQTPTRERNHNGYLLRLDGHGVLVDPGEGTQRQLLLAGLSGAAVDRVALTHLHGDHCLGLPGVLARRALDGVGEPAVLHYPVAESHRVRCLLEGPAVAEPFAVVHRPVPPGGGHVDRFGVWSVTALPLDHPVPTVGYRFTEDDGWRFDPDRLAAAGVRGPAVGELARTGRVRVAGRTVRLGDVATPRPGQVVAVIMDTGVCDAAHELAAGADLCLCEATYTDADRPLARRHHHLTAGDAARMAARAGVRRLVLVHFSQRYPDLGDHLRDARAHHPDVVVATDLTRVALPPRAGRTGRSRPPEARHPPAP